MAIHSLSRQILVLSQPAADRRAVSALVSRLLRRDTAAAMPAAPRSTHNAELMRVPMPPGSKGPSRTAVGVMARIGSACASRVAQWCLADQTAFPPRGTQQQDRARDRCGQKWSTPGADQGSRDPAVEHQERLAERAEHGRHGRAVGQGSGHMTTLGRQPAADAGPNSLSTR